MRGDLVWMKESGSRIDNNKGKTDTAGIQESIMNNIKRETAGIL